MSNKLNTLSPNQIEQLISERFSEYLDEACSCTVSNLSTPNIDNEENIALDEERTITFEVKLSYDE